MRRWCKRSAEVERRQSWNADQLGHRFSSEVGWRNNSSCSELFVQSPGALRAPFPLSQLYPSCSNQLNTIWPRNRLFLLNGLHCRFTSRLNHLSIQRFSTVWNCYLVRSTLFLETLSTALIIDSHLWKFQDILTSSKIWQSSKKKLAHFQFYIASCCSDLSLLN